MGSRSMLMVSRFLRIKSRYHRFQSRQTIRCRRRVSEARAGGLTNLELFTSSGDAVSSSIVVVSH